MESDFIKSVELIAEYESYDQFRESDHFKLSSISVSKLKKIKKSPLHFREEETPDTDAFKFGSAYHCYLLEPGKFKDQYHIIDEKTIIDQLIGEGSKKPRSTSKYKEWLSEHYETANAAGKIILTGDEYYQIMEMSSRINRHPYAKSLITNGVAERFLFVRLIDMFENEYFIKLIPDYLKKEKRVCTDLKSAADASNDVFTKASANNDYHIQAALYSDILAHLYGGSFKFYFLAQEKSKPFAFNIFHASNQFISQGRYEYEMLLLLWKQCVTDGKYPGYQVWCENKYGVNELSLPAWSIKPLDYYANNL